MARKAKGNQERAAARRQREAVESAVPSPAVPQAAHELLAPAFLAPAAIIVLAVLIYYALTWKSFHAFTIAIDHCEEQFCDFYRHYFPMGQEIFVIKQPVPGFFYSPFFAILLAAFRPFTLDTALVVWGIIQAVLVLCLAALPLLFGLRSVRYLLLHLFLVLTAFPVLHNFKWGQVSVPLVLALFASLSFYQRGRFLPGALLFAFAVSLKFYPAVFLVLFLFRGAARFVALAVGAAILLLVVVPVAALGTVETIRFYRLLLDALDLARQWMASDPNSQYLPHVFTRLAACLTHDTLDLESRFLFLGYAVASANSLLVYVTLRLDRPQTSVWGMVLLFLTVPFTVRTSWPHYFVYLPFCQVFLWQQIAAQEHPPARRILEIALLIVPSIICSNVVLFNLIGESTRYSFFGLLFFADALLLVACYLVLVPAVVRRVGAEMRLSGLSRHPSALNCRKWRRRSMRCERNPGLERGRRPR